MNIKQLRVSSSTSVPQLATSILLCIEEGNNVEVRAVGAGAVNQMYKALAVTRSMMAGKGKDLLIRPGFDEVDNENGEKRTVMVARVIIQ